MIEPLTVKKVNYGELISFVIEHFDYDFYITENNVRLYMTDKQNLKKFFKQTALILQKKEKGDYKGLIGVWKSIGGAP